MKQQTAEVYDTCQTAMFSAFQKATLHSDLSGFIKYGNPTDKQLEAAWDKVFNEYLEISGDTHIKATLSLMKDIAMLTNKITLIELIVAQMSVSHVGAFGDQLREMGFRFQYEDGPELLKELQLTLNQTVQLKMQLEESKQEYQELQRGETAELSDQDYEVFIAGIEKFQGVRIDPNGTTISRYCAIVKHVKMHNEVNTHGGR